MRGKIIDLRTEQDVVGAMRSSDSVMDAAGRAEVFIGDPYIHYHLQYPNGGTDPAAPQPQDRSTGGCDCIGFAAYCAGFDRYQPKKFPYYDGYINTDSMIEEATKRGKWFTVLEKPEPGCFIVSASFFSKLRLRRVIGHIGVVVDCSEYATKGLAGIHVVHCSSSNAKRPGNRTRSAVWKTDGTVWKGYPKVYFIRFNRDYALGLKA